MNSLTRLLGWVDDRFPLTKLWKEHLSEYYAPKNFNFWYFFGSLALLVLVIQIVSGIFLTMHYKPDAALAFYSVEYIMRDVDWGWLIRYVHSTGASMFFAVVYLHMFRGLIYGSYRKPRELIWIFGMLIYLCLMAEAFMGYLLPWGQMSYWGAQVIVNLFAAVPFIGPDLSIWIRGDYVISDATLNRFFAFHVAAVPLVLIGLVVAHIIALHEVGSNNPDGVEIKKHKDPVTHIPLDGIPFHPYYTVKDIVGVVVFLMVFSAIVFFAPDLGGYFIEYNNFVPADPLNTPAHIAPVWYFTPFYAVLRAVPPMFGSQFPGVIAMGVAVMIIFFLPWLDRSPAKSIRYRGPIYKTALTLFVISFI
ncbi:MAG: cytochrome bc complex cytochrome b subunit, partial [Sulfuricella sp.]|nr:cytochrome bc complex cytochrome b subunit [Sulfuricella sp.]